MECSGLDWSNQKEEDSTHVSSLCGKGFPATILWEAAPAKIPSSTYLLEDPGVLPSFAFDQSDHLEQGKIMKLFCIKQMALTAPFSHGTMPTNFNF